MPVYTAHEPPRRDRDNDLIAHTARFQFVRDGFHFWAFLLAPLWMLRRLGIEETAGAWVALLFAFLIGMEAPSLRRWKLSRRGFEYRGIVVADDLELAERRFFDGWMATDEAPAPAAPTSFLHPGGTAANDVLGLFPQPEARP